MATGAADPRSGKMRAEFPTIHVDKLRLDPAVCHDLQAAY